MTVAAIIAGMPRGNSHHSSSTSSEQGYTYSPTTKEQEEFGLGMMVFGSIGLVLVLVYLLAKVLRRTD